METSKNRPTKNQIWISTADLMTMLSFGRTKLNELVKTNQFPQPIRLTSNFIRWDLAEVNEWIEQQKATRGAA
ncbi:AlpA family transcriptional regulator [Testudinibacter aquarius]|uniref:AlpA family phage regulatory protein n=2 Tax=Testudinibacter aquarius TaxID=1524974 RepID=A0A4R3Y4A6_9PAST|nr:AlpA family transcriptional regulator [Testudinibacter aquarius]TCV86517.1 AlpA family transcriptional regulator [Testudinibacter aquarius]TNG92637.1 AlpA family phage regulatory protein [Testudinibacter aquarius]